MSTIQTMHAYLNPSNAFAQLSLRDLLEAREKYHVDLMNYPNVVATAVGRYRIRKSDPLSNDKRPKMKGPKTVRTLENSEVRPYSWPAILVFVERWQEETEIEGGANKVLPKTLYLSDGRAVPVCVIEAPKEAKTEIEARNIKFPLNNIGAGNGIVAVVQGRQYAATVTCLVGDGHKVYALTNRHVTGAPGEVVYSQLDGKLERIGASDGMQVSRELFSDLYPGWPGNELYVNVDAGVIEIDDLDRWTTTVGMDGVETGPMVDMALSNAMSLIGCPVRGLGAASGEMNGEVQALFYRYKSVGGFEYVADLLIGPRSVQGKKGKKQESSFSTLPGDSGALWLLEATNGEDEKKKSPLLPLAMQWGRNMLYSATAAKPQSYALASLLSTVCTRLGVDPIRGWNIDQPDTWGALGHYSIAARTQDALSDRFPKLSALMESNALIISHDDQTLLKSDFKGLGSADFVALADVPDFFWKPRISKQGHSRGMEGPNHFADMDQPDSTGKTLLDLCKDPKFIDPDEWNKFYDSVDDMLSGEKISQVHRGLLPFRVWQIFDEMVTFVKNGDAAEFVCAAGVLTHYVGDACQPLHISYLHDGDPLRKYEYTYQNGKKAGTSEWRPLGMGVHSAYEDEMVNAYREDILAALKKTSPPVVSDYVTNGYEAAQATVELMRGTFQAIPPEQIVNAFVAYKGRPKDRAAYMWKNFGADTISVMKDGTHLLAVLWESAWKAGNGEQTIKTTKAIAQDLAMTICGNPDFVPSYSIGQIGKYLRRPNES